MTQPRKKWRPRPKPIVMTAREALDFGKADLEELKDEVEDVVNNLEEHWSQTSRYEMLSEANDALTAGFDQIYEIDQLVEELDALDNSILDASINLNLWQGRYVSSRARRLDNIVMQLEAAKDHLESSIPDDEDETKSDLREKLEALVDAIGNGTDEVQGINFPGMYG